MLTLAKYSGNHVDDDIVARRRAVDDNDDIVVNVKCKTVIKKENS